MNTALHAAGAPLLGQRVAQIAYGANRDLHNLAWKLRSYAQQDESSEDSESVVIVVPARLHDADVVACNIGCWGYVYAAALLHRPPALVRPYLAGASVDVALLLLDEKQMRAMHRSEGVPLTRGPRAGVSCDVAMIECHVPGPDITCGAQMYTLPLPLLSFDHERGRTPVPFSAVRRRGGTPLLRFSQTEMWERIASALSLEDPLQIVSTLRAGALLRATGDPGASSTTLALYSRIRSLLSERMPLLDPDGVIRTGTEGVPGSLDLATTWHRPHLVGYALHGCDVPSGAV